MGLVRRFKSWVQRTVTRLVLKFARTRFARFMERVGEASAVPLAITGAGALVGTGVASAAGDTLLLLLVLVFVALWMEVCLWSSVLLHRYPPEGHVNCPKGNLKAGQPSSLQRLELSCLHGFDLLWMA